MELKNNIAELLESKGLDAFIFAEFAFKDEVEIETLRKKFYFIKENEIDESLKRLQKRGFLEFFSKVSCSAFTCPEQGSIDVTQVTKWILTDKGKKQFNR
jgi:coproporphyrinogen III oxidase-like Fe-S oxidoreductase